MELNRVQIIKILECHGDDQNCVECPLTDVSECHTIMAKAVLALFIRDLTEVKAEWGRPIYINGAGNYTIPCSHCYYSTSVRSKDFRPNFCSNCGAKMTNATVPNEEI